MAGKKGIHIERDRSQEAPDDDGIDQRMREAELLGEIDMISGSSKQLSAQKLNLFKGLDYMKIRVKLQLIQQHVSDALALVN